MAHAPIQRRVILLLWLVRTGSKGHFPAELHIELLTELQALLPQGASVVLLGDGEFDSVELQTFLADAGGDYVCRIAKNTQICLDGEWMSLDEYFATSGASSHLSLYSVFKVRYPGLGHWLFVKSVFDYSGSRVDFRR